jgi:hypothetical protein
MELRERRAESVERIAGAGEPVPTESGTLDAAREAADRFLRAGDLAIARALSGDSEAFLRSSRQEGGQ